MHGINCVINYVTLIVLEHSYDTIASSIVLLSCELLQKRKNDPCLCLIFINFPQSGCVLLLLIPSFPRIFIIFISANRLEKSNMWR